MSFLRELWIFEREYGNFCNESESESFGLYIGKNLGHLNRLGEGQPAVTFWKTLWAVNTKLDSKKAQQHQAC